MSYQALYRKFRPTNFEEVRGQAHIVTTLKNQLESGRVGHAYVFSGTRGTGKTSIAKIFARALNCENPQSGNPCNNCASCNAILKGSSMGVVEIDAASNRGIEDVRRIIEDVSYPPVDEKYKVYIIDEVHMLTKEAFNALLKTIEEPPNYAVFILATTEVGKIPLTIMSRCQRYDFHRMSVETIANRIKELSEAENISIEDRAIKYIARQADGSMRDSLSIFDQCISYYYDKEITYDLVLEMLGTADTKIYSALFRAINNHDAKTSIELAEEAIIRGMEPEAFVSDFTWYLRNLLLVKNGEKLEDVADISTEDSVAFLEEVSIANNDFIMRCITVLSELLNELKLSQVKRATLEVGLIRLCRPQMDTDYSALLDRIRVLESGVQIAAATSNIQPISVENIKEETDLKLSPKEEDIPEQFYDPDFYHDYEDDDTSLQTTEEIDTDQDNHIAVSSGEGIAAVWSFFINTLNEPEKSSASKGVIVQNGKDKADLYFEKKGTAGGFYSNKENRINGLKQKIDDYMKFHTEITFHFVDEKDMPVVENKIVEDESDSGDFFANIKNAGIPIETEDY